MINYVSFMDLYSDGVFMKCKFQTVSIVFLICLFAFADFSAAQMLRPRQTRPNTVPQSNLNHQQRAFRVDGVPSPPVSNQPGTNYAILVGINTYLPAESSTNEFLSFELKNLKYCIDDMTGLKEALIDSRYTEEKNINLLITTPETTRSSILKTLEDFRKKLKPNDNILIALSGHGVSLASKNSPDVKVDYYCCSDTKVVYLVKHDEFRHEGLLPMSDVNSLLESYPCKSKIIFTDACRNILGEEGQPRDITNSAVNAASVFSRSMIGGIAGNPEERQKEVKGFFRMASCSKEEVSYELVSLKHGVFTHYLIKGLGGDADKKDNEGKGGNGDGNITLHELFNYACLKTSDYVWNNVGNNKTQTPTLSSMETTGDFVIGKCEPKKPLSPPPSSMSNSPPRHSSPPIINPN